MAEAGYRDTNEDGILEDEKGKKLTLTILVNRNNSSRTDSAGFISDALEEIGIKTTVKSLSWADYKQAIEDGEFDLYLGGYKFDKKSNLRTMFKSGNAISYKNTQVRSLVNQLETCLSAKKQKAVYEELKPLLTEDCLITVCFIRPMRLSLCLSLPRKNFLPSSIFTEAAAAGSGIRRLPLRLKTVKHPKAEKVPKKIKIGCLLFGKVSV